jgi:hypothetical protein
MAAHEHEREGTEADREVYPVARGLEVTDPADIPPDEGDGKAEAAAKAQGGS